TNRPHPRRQQAKPHHKPPPPRPLVNGQVPSHSHASERGLRPRDPLLGGATVPQVKPQGRTASRYDSVGLLNDVDAATPAPPRPRDQRQRTVYRVHREVTTRRGTVRYKGGGRRRQACDNRWRGPRRPPPNLDRLLGLDVEIPQPFGVDRQLDALVDLHSHRGLDPGHDGTAADPEIEEDLGAGGLPPLYHRVEDVLGRISAGCHMDVLGPYAQRDRLALVGLQHGGPGGWHGQL